MLVDYEERREMVELALRMKGLEPAKDHNLNIKLEDLLAESYGASNGQ